MLWKQVTEHDDTKVLINLDHVRSMFRVDDSTTIHFTDGGDISVTEKPDAILKSSSVLVQE